VANPVRRFFWLAFALTWGIGFVGLGATRLWPALHPFASSSPFYWLAGYSVSLVGIGMTATSDGRAGLEQLLQRLAPGRAHPLWYLAVVGGYGLITFAAREGATLAGMTVMRLPDPLALLAGLCLTLATDVGPLGEEFGWRGFALPRLLDRWSPLVASLILGGIHALWHVPLFFIASMPQSRLGFPLFAVGVIAIAIADTWMYLRTEANLLLAILVHLLANYCGGLFSPTSLAWFFGAEGVAALVIVLCGGLKRPDRLDRRAAVGARAQS